MRYLLYISVLLALFFPAAHSAAQERGGVALHADPRLTLLINKTRNIDKPETSKALASAGKPKPGKIKPPRGAAALTKDIATDDIKPAAPKAVSAHAADAKPVAEKALAKPDLADDSKPLKPVKHSSIIGADHGAHYTGQGYRVQIYNGPDRQKALKVKADFMSHNPGVHTYLFYASPHYKVKAGDFRHRQDAVGLFRSANAQYSPCMIVPDMVSTNAN